MLQQYTTYMMRLLAWPTVFISLSLTSIIWLTQALRFIDFIINRGLSIGDFLYLTMLLIPSLMLFIVPISLFVAVLFAYNKLQADSELVVMRAAGLSPLQLARPAVLVAIAVSAFCYLLALYVMPMANRQFRDTQAFLRDNYTSVLLQEEVFNSPTDGLTVFVRERDDDGVLHGVLVHDNRQQADPITMMAEEARLVQTESGPRFYLVNGLRQERHEGRVSWLNFDSYNLDLSLFDSSIGDRTRKPEEMFLSELFDETVQDENLRRKYAAEGHQRLTWPLYALGLSLLGLTVLLRGEFSRRGQWKRIATASIAATGCVGGALGLTNMVTKFPESVPVLYILIATLIIGSVMILSSNGTKSIPLHEGVSS